MAEGARERANSPFGLAITGIAGPGGGTADKPLGLVLLALAAPDGTWTRSVQLGTRREWNRVYSSLLALDMLRRHAQQLPIGDKR